MSFLSPSFYLFFAGLLLLLTAAKKESFRQAILLFASYIFYACISRRFLLLLFLLSVMTWGIGFAMGDPDIDKASGSRKRKRILILGVTISILILAAFKYNGFFAAEMAEFLHADAGFLILAMPVGLSFYICQAISYMADVYTGKIGSRTRVRDVLLYVGFFPQMLSGPIVKARDFLPQLSKEHPLKAADFSSGACLFLMGLFKKTVIADRLGAAVDAVYSAPAAYSTAAVWFAVIGYAIQLYCDFSGYSDMAIGCARILGYDLGMNFDLPYLSGNPSEFWKRWHISLSSWLQEYVYIPLGGSRKGKIRTYINLLLTMFVSGLWHGAGITFVLWGLLHGLWLSLHRMISKRMKKAVFPKTLQIAGTFFVVMLLWIPFRSGDLAQTQLILQRMFVPCAGISFISVFTVLYTLLIMGGMIVLYIRGNGHRKEWQPDLMTFKGKFMVCILILIILCFSYIGNGAFIYAAF